MGAGFLYVYIVYGLSAENLRQNEDWKPKSPRAARAFKHLHVLNRLLSKPASASLLLKPWNYNDIN